MVNGLGLPSTALCDTGAQTKLLMSPSLAQRMEERLEARMATLDKKISFQDYRNQPAGSAKRSITCCLEIDGRQFNQQTFLITETGHDVYIGLHWWQEQNVLLHPRSLSIIWPDDLPALAKFNKPIEMPPKCPLPYDPSIESDIRHRDKLMKKEDKRYHILRRPHQGREPETEDLEDIQLIAALTQKVESHPLQARWKDLPMPTEAIPFERITVGAMEPHSWKTYTGAPIPFPPEENLEHIQMVRKKIPKEIAHLEGFFSKQQAHTLPRSRPEHDVLLEEEGEKPATGPPKYSTPPQYLPLEKETVERLLKEGFIEPCMEMDASPVLFIPKPHSPEKRFVIDYRWRNKYLKSRLVNTPDLAGTIHSCRNAKKFSKIDIIQAFHRMLLQEASKRLTAFRTRLGTFQWKVLPFGLKVGPAWFQKFINSLLQELLDWIASAYADDVLIHSEDEREHWAHVEEVIFRLHNAQLQGDITKSEFFVDKVNYLGVVLEAGKGTSIDPAKTKAIINWEFKDLCNRTAVKSFLGLCNYIRMFCHHASDIAEPLNRLLKKDQLFEAGREQEQAFNQMKKLATTAPVLAFFQPGAPTRVETDASKNATGGVIWQLQQDDSWKPTGFFSKTMTPAERAYPIQDRELLAIVQTLEHYRPELTGQKFDVITDHQALLYFNTKRKLSTRQIRWSHILADFDVDFRYRPGKENIAADALSRKTSENPTVKARELEERTMALIPSEIRPAIKIAALQGADLADIIKQENEEQNLGKDKGRLIVPEQTRDRHTFLRTALLHELHAPKIFAHQGQNKMIKMIQQDYYWPGMSRDVRRFVNNCYDCKRNKTPRDKTPGLLHSLPVPQEVWSHVVVDGKDMPKDRHGFDYVWVFVDKFSRLIASLPGNKKDNAEKLAGRYYRSLYRILGMPDIWISDNAGPFISGFLQEVNRLTGTKHRHGSAFHPQTQGAVEVTNQCLDQRLRFYVDKYQDDWSTHLPALDFAHNSTWHSAINMAPLKVLLGKEVRNPLTPLSERNEQANSGSPATRAQELLSRTRLVQEQALEAAKQTQARQEGQVNKKRRPVDFRVGDKVFLKKRGFSTSAPTTRLDSQWVGPFKINEERGHSFVLDLPPYYKMKNLFHADRLRKAPETPLPQQHQSPPPPEEINGEPEWEVDMVEESRLFRGKELQYRVRWKGCDPDEEWYSAGNFKNAPIALKNFHEEHPEAPGPPRRLEKWIEAAANDEEAQSHTDDNKAVRKGQKTRARRHT